MAQRQHCRITSSRCYWKSHPMTLFMLFFLNIIFKTNFKKVIIWCTLTLPVIGLEASICIHTERITNSKDFLCSFLQNRRKKGKSMIQKLGLSSNRVQLLNLLNWKVSGSGSVASSVLIHRLMKPQSSIHSFVLNHAYNFFTVPSYLKVSYYKNKAKCCQTAWC